MEGTWQQGESHVMGEPTSNLRGRIQSQLHAHVAHVLLASAALALPLRALADTPGAPASEATPADAAGSESAAPESSGLGEVVVTAQRRSESGQSVPISIATFDAAQLQSV